MRPVEIQNAFENFPYGLFAAALHTDDGGVSAIIATWVMQVSFDPPLVALSLEKGSWFLEHVQRKGTFGVSMLPADGIQVAKGILKGGSHAAGSEVSAAFETRAGGPPVLKESPAALTCSVENIHEAGDHCILVGRVVTASGNSNSRGLLLETTGWKYRPKKKR
jgi:flavin reductase (DIM6/NTAB) family NADH-FMN oxidoreductase RutF